MKERLGILLYSGILSLYCSPSFACGLTRTTVSDMRISPEFSRGGVPSFTDEVKHQEDHITSQRIRIQPKPRAQFEIEVFTENESALTTLIPDSTYEFFKELHLKIHFTWKDKTPEVIRFSSLEALSFFEALLSGTISLDRRQAAGSSAKISFRKFSDSLLEGEETYLYSRSTEELALLLRDAFLIAEKKIFSFKNILDEANSFIFSNNEERDSYIRDLLIQNRLQLQLILLRNYLMGKDLKRSSITPTLFNQILWARQEYTLAIAAGEFKRIDALKPVPSIIGQIYRMNTTEDSLDPSTSKMTSPFLTPTPDELLKEKLQPFLFIDTNAASIALDLTSQVEKLEMIPNKLFSDLFEPSPSSF